MWQRIRSIRVNHVPLAGFKTRPVTEKTEKGGRGLKFIKSGLQKKKISLDLRSYFLIFVFAMVKIREPRVTMSRNTGKSV